ncbi:MAG: glycerate kinase [Nitrospiraceae bacterium]|nr:MAG: glycerate kinase [Nitrospiraceae bacterium]
MRNRDIADKIFRSALAAVNPKVIVEDCARKIISSLNQQNIKNIIVVGFGKAAYQMALAVEEVIDIGLISDGLVVTKYGHAQLQGSGKKGEGSALRKIKVFEAAHPIPDENGIKATEEIIKLLEGAGEETLVLCLISGGGSALLVSPINGVSLSEKQLITDLLLRAGADIEELNAVRKHLSKVKGGRLAELTFPAKLKSIIISDVIGDKLDVIASGPTSADSSTFSDALNVIDKYDLFDKAPQSIITVLKKGAAGKIPDTPKPDNPLFTSIQNIIVGSNQKAVEAAVMEARSAGLETRVLSSSLTGEAREVARWLADKSKEAFSSGNKRTQCFISGGETVVTVKGKGKGGRNTELALSFAMEVEGSEGITLLSAGTDGTDGPTDAAGAIVDGDTMIKAREMGLDPTEYLNDNDSYNFFRELDSLIITGPTGTNVMDLQIIILSN